MAANARMLCNAGLAAMPDIAAYDAVLMNWRREWSILLIVSYAPFTPSTLCRVFRRSHRQENSRLRARQKRIVDGCRISACRHCNGVDGAKNLAAQRGRHLAPKQQHVYAIK